MSMTEPVPVFGVMIALLTLGWWLRIFPEKFVLFLAEETEEDEEEPGVEESAFSMMMGTGLFEEEGLNSEYPLLCSKLFLLGGGNIELVSWLTCGETEFGGETREWMFELLWWLPASAEGVFGFCSAESW